MEFSVDISSEDGATVLKLSGPIDENSQFPAVETGAGKVILDLQSVKHINSIGIKMWIQWISPVAHACPVEFRNCPKSIVLQMNMVKNFLPAGAKVSSFYLPLFCEACDQEQSMLLNVGRDIIAHGEEVEIKTKPSDAMGCTKSDCEAEVDVIPKKYFRFLAQGS